MSLSFSNSWKTINDSTAYSNTLNEGWIDIPPPKISSLVARASKNLSSSGKSFYHLTPSSKESTVSGFHKIYRSKEAGIEDGEVNEKNVVELFSSKDTRKSSFNEAIDGTKSNQSFHSNNNDIHPRVVNSTRPSKLLTQESGNDWNEDIPIRSSFFQSKTSRSSNPMTLPNYGSYEASKNSNRDLITPKFVREDSNSRSTYRDSLYDNVTRRSSSNEPSMERKSSSSSSRNGNSSIDKDFTWESSWKDVAIKPSSLISKVVNGSIRSDSKRDSFRVSSYMENEKTRQVSTDRSGFRSGDSSSNSDYNSVHERYSRPSEVSNQSTSRSIPRLRSRSRSPPPPSINRQTSILQRSQSLDYRALSNTLPITNYNSNDPSKVVSEYHPEAHEDTLLSINRLVQSQSIVEFPKRSKSLDMMPSKNTNLILLHSSENALRTTSDCKGHKPNPVSMTSTFHEKENFSKKFETSAVTSVSSVVVTNNLRNGNFEDKSLVDAVAHSRNEIKCNVSKSSSNVNVKIDEATTIRQISNSNSSLSSASATNTVSMNNIATVNSITAKKKSRKCGVCAGTNGGDDLWTCLSCSISCHGTCSGGSGFVTEAGDWICAVCHGGAKNICCSLCFTNVDGLYLTKCSPLSECWIHPLCRRATNSIEIPSPSSCAICKTATRYLLVNCAYDGCSERFHPGCCYRKKFKMVTQIPSNIKEELNPLVSKVEESLIYDNNPYYTIDLYCMIHSKKDIQLSVAVKKNLSGKMLPPTSSERRFNIESMESVNFSPLITTVTAFNPDDNGVETVVEDEGEVDYTIRKEDIKTKIQVSSVSDHSKISKLPLLSPRKSSSQPSFIQDAADLIIINKIGSFKQYKNIVKLLYSSIDIENDNNLNNYSECNQYMLKDSSFLSWDRNLNTDLYSTFIENISTSNNLIVQVYGIMSSSVECESKFEAILLSPDNNIIGLVHLPIHGLYLLTSYNQAIQSLRRMNIHSTRKVADQMDESNDDIPQRNVKFVIVQFTLSSKNSIPNISISRERERENNAMRNDSDILWNASSCAFCRRNSLSPSSSSNERNNTFNHDDIENVDDRRSPREKKDNFRKTSSKIEKDWAKISNMITSERIVNFTKKLSKISPLKEKKPVISKLKTVYVSDDDDDDDQLDKDTNMLATALGYVDSNGTKPITKLLTCNLEMLPLSSSSNSDMGVFLESAKTKNTTTAKTETETTMVDSGDEFCNNSSKIKPFQTHSQVTEGLNIKSMNPQTQDNHDDGDDDGSSNDSNRNSNQSKDKKSDSVTKDNNEKIDQDLSREFKSSREVGEVDEENDSNMMMTMQMVNTESSTDQIVPISHHSIDDHREQNKLASNVSQIVSDYPVEDKVTEIETHDSKRKRVDVYVEDSEDSNSIYSKGSDILIPKKKIVIELLDDDDSRSSNSSHNEI